MESDCVFKANERMVLRLFLTSLSIEDLSDMTLYPKVRILILIFHFSNLTL
jgi:hypothetical protein